MYVCNFGGKGRNLTLQGNVIDVTFVLQSSFFCLATKERSKEKFKAYFFLLLASCTPLKGRNSLRSNSLPFLRSVTGARLTEKKVGRGKPCGWERLLGEMTGWSLGVAVIGAWLVGLWVAGCYLNKAGYIVCIALGWRGFRAFFF